MDEILAPLNSAGKILLISVKSGCHSAERKHFEKLCLKFHLCLLWGETSCWLLWCYHPFFFRSLLSSEI